MIDFSASINPVGPPDWLRSCLADLSDGVQHYPDPEYRDFKKTISEKKNIDYQKIVVSNGTSELLYLLLQVLAPHRVVIPVPSYIDYVHAAQISGSAVTTLELKPDNGFVLDCTLLDSEIKPGDLVLLGTPNNPTGISPSHHQLCRLVEKNPEVTFLFDEAFIDFDENTKSFSACYNNVVTINSLTKIYAVPALRVGYGVLPAHIKQKVEPFIAPWNVNEIACQVGIRCLQDELYVKNSLSRIRELKEQLYQDLSTFDQLHCFHSDANFFLLRIEQDAGYGSLQKYLEKRGILIRNCGNFAGLDESYFRIAVRLEHQNRNIIRALKSFFENRDFKRITSKKKKKHIMFQGTSSNAGKSVLAAAMCRILLQDGLRCAPFKSQNMSLNSYVTKDRKEMGRAQVVQALAAKIDPDVKMNPVLLKPNSDIGSQVIVEGISRGNMNVIEYSRYKKECWKSVKSCFHDLEDEYDIIVLEGAGSPGEVNLKHDDIVNMKMAAEANAAVYLVGDIDRGGVYASIVGTMGVLSHWEKELVAGFIINRFRGNRDLLKPAHDFLRLALNREVFGVVPYIQQLGIPEEDSVSFKSGETGREIPDTDYIEIAVLDLPHISNFTDIEPFQEEPDVYVKVVESPDDLAGADVVIIPGSKNVASDYNFLKKQGFIDEITRKAENGCEIVGICGGYIMLGEKVEDPDRIESSRKCFTTTGLLPFTTVLNKDKKLVQKRGIHRDSGVFVSGYEIHHGISSSADTIFAFDDGSACGHGRKEPQVWGAYLHGMFDSDPFRRWFIDKNLEKKGYEPKRRILYSYDVDQAIDRLAGIVRENVNIDKIYSDLGL